MEIRWLIRADMDAVLRIERESFEEPWSEKEFLELLRERNHIGMVGVVNRKVVAFMIYDLGKKSLELKTLAVEVELRRSGIGRAMIDKLLSKLSTQRRTKIEAFVRERNLPAQLFFSRLGFNCEESVPDLYEGYDEAAYRFVYSIKPVFKNRISEYLSEPENGYLRDTET